MSSSQPGIYSTNLHSEKGGTSACKAARRLLRLICTLRELVSGYWKNGILLGTQTLKMGTSFSMHWKDLDSIFVGAGGGQLQALTKARYREIAYFCPGSILRECPVWGSCHISESGTFAYRVLLARQRVRRDGRGGRRQRKEERSC